MTASLHGKVALVTGAASGIGRASALRLAAEGALIMAADLDAQGLAALCDTIASQGGTAIAHSTDIGDPKAVSALVDRSRQEMHTIDVLVHAAGICPRCPVLEMSDDEWRRVQRINLDGTFYITRDVGRVMVERKAGTMILVASDRGLYGSVDYAHYAASKGGVLALSRSLALSLGKFGVTVNSINPGMTDTPLARAAVAQWDDKLRLDVLGKASLPEEIAETVLFLAGTAGSYMTGQLVGTRLRHGA